MADSNTFGSITRSASVAHFFESDYDLFGVLTSSSDTGSFTETLGSTEHEFASVGSTAGLGEFSLSVQAFEQTCPPLKRAAKTGRFRGREES